MALKADQERVRTLLTETITLLCKNGLHYQSEFSIEGLIAITVDGQEIFLVSLKETFHVPANLNNLNVKESDSPQVLHSVQTKPIDSGKSPDSMEFCEVLQVHATSSGRCSKRSRKSIMPFIDPLKKDLNNFIEPNDLDQISQTFKGPHSSNDISDISTTNRETFIHVEPYQPSFIDMEGDSNLHAKDLNSQSMTSTNPLTIQNEDSITDTKIKLSHIKKELDDSDVIGDCITIEPRMAEEMNDSLLPNYPSRKVQRATTFHGSDVGIYQPSALRSTATSLSRNPARNQAEPWHGGGRLPPRKAGSTGGMKRHTCQMCNKSFTFASALTHHENNIHGRRPHPFKCFICGKGFWNQRSMRGHMTSKHLMQTEFCCPICHKEYAYKVSLRDHMILYHNMTL